MNQDTNKRIVKLVDARLQLSMTLWITCTAVVALVVQWMLFTNAMKDFALNQPNPVAAYDGIASACLSALFMSLAFALPMTIAVGVMTTFKVAGPIQRFRDFLNDLRDGKQPADCKIRKGDQLQDFCELLNDATASIRAEEQSHRKSA